MPIDHPGDGNLGEAKQMELLLKWLPPYKMLYRSAGKTSELPCLVFRRGGPDAAYWQDRGPNHPFALRMRPIQGWI